MWVTELWGPLLSPCRPSQPICQPPRAWAFFCEEICLSPKTFQFFFKFKFFFGHGDYSRHSEPGGKMFIFVVNRLPVSTNNSSWKSVVLESSADTSLGCQTLCLEVGLQEMIPSWQSKLCPFEGHTSHHGPVTCIASSQSFLVSSVDNNPWHSEQMCTLSQWFLNLLANQACMGCQAWFL